MPDHNAEMISIFYCNYPTSTSTMTTNDSLNVEFRATFRDTLTTTILIQSFNKCNLSTKLFYYNFFFVYSDFVVFYWVK